MASVVRRVDRAGVGEPRLSWHRARRIRVFGEGEADWRVAAC